MRILHRYGLPSTDKRALRALKKQSVEFDKDALVAVVEIFENDEKFNIVDKIMRQSDALHTKEAVYDSAEIERAEWLTVRTDFWTQYPQPEEDKGYIFSTYDTANYCPGNEPDYYCGKGLSQKDSFVLKKRPRWGARNFMMLNWVADELFVSNKAKQALQESGLKGFAFLNVNNKKGEPLDNVSQLCVKNRLPAGLAEKSVEKRFVCPVCGYTKFLLGCEPIQFDKKCFANLSVDIVKTTECFGEIGCDSLILIDHKFYEEIKKNKLDRGLIFAPIELI